MSNNSNSSGGVGFFGLLILIFITLKLMGYITWSWWWILSPIWIIFLLVFFVMIVGALAQTVKNSREKKK